MREDDLYRSFGRAIAEKRNGRMTQLELARAIGISRASLANIERGEQRVYIHQLLGLMQVLGGSPDDFLPHPSEFRPIALAKVSVSGDKVNRAQERAIKELVSAITTASRKAS